MKKINSLTYLLATILLSACSSSSSAAFSSSKESLPSESLISSDGSSSKSELSSQENSSVISESSLNESSELSSESISTSSSSNNSESSSSVGPITYGDYYHGYYQGLTTWENGEDLKNKLNTIIRTGYTPLSYAKSNNPNFTSNVEADHALDDFEYVDAVYTENNYYKDQRNKGGWEREHAFCASLMCGSGTGDAVSFLGRATDFHNLFAADASANGSRGNKNYGKADTSASNYTNRTTNNGDDGYSYSSNFEPGNKDKGRLARAIFYMATMYKDDEYDSKNNITMKGLTIVENPVDYVQGNNCAFAHGNLSELLKWNRVYDVDLLEMQHNVSVYTNTNNLDGVAQGNRNPYVDYPDLVDYVYGNKKDQPGSLDQIMPSAYYLNIKDKVISHYALKEANREKDYGETITPDDYQVVAVYTDFTYETVNQGLTHSFANKTFNESDGEKVDVSITTPRNTINYQISLNPMASCSTGIIAIDKTGINNKTPNVEQSVTYGGVGFDFSFSTSYSDFATTGVTIANDNQKGGFTFGSGNRPITGATFQTKQSYTVNKVCIKCYAGNTSSSYKLTIKVSDEILLNEQVVSYNNNQYKVFSAISSLPKTGQISLIFTGSNCIKIHSIAFNEIIA